MKRTTGYRSRAAAYDGMHTLVFTSAVLTQPADSGIATAAALGYVNAPGELGFKECHTYQAMSVFKLVGYQANVQIQNGGDAGVGVMLRLSFLCPTAGRVKALQAAAMRWKQTINEPDLASGAIQNARLRQFWPTYDDEQPTGAFHSLIEVAGGAALKMSMIDRGVVAAWGVFDDYNARNPIPPAPTVTEDAVVPTDPRLYTTAVTEFEDVLTASAWSSSSGSTELAAGVPFTTDFHAQGQNHSPVQFAPAGMYWPVLGGQIRIDLAQVIPGDGSIQIAETYRVGLTTFWSGWRKLQG